MKEELLWSGLYFFDQGIFLISRNPDQELCGIIFRGFGRQLFLKYAKNKGLSGNI